MITDYDRLIMMVIRDMTERDLWVCGTEIHRLINLVGVHQAPRGAELDEWERYYLKTLKRLFALIKKSYVREVEIHQYGTLWEHFRLTRKGHDAIRGKEAPDEIRKAIKPVFIDFAEIDRALAGGMEPKERREFVPMSRRTIKVQTRPYWNSGAGYHPIK